MRYHRLQHSFPNIRPSIRCYFRFRYLKSLPFLGKYLCYPGNKGIGFRSAHTLYQNLPTSARRSLNPHPFYPSPELDCLLIPSNSLDSLRQLFRHLPTSDSVGYHLTFLPHPNNQNQARLEPPVVKISRLSNCRRHYRRTKRR